MPKPLSVLIVEDSENDTRLLVRELERTGYAPSWERVETAGSMRSALEGRIWDLVIADYSMPKFNAPSALALLQDMGLDIPFIILSGTIGEDIAVECMRAGAHDFFLKENLTRFAPAVERELEQAAHRKARRVAEESNQRLLRAVEAAGNAIFMTDPDGTITYVNPAFEEIYGYSKNEAFGKTPRILKSGQHDQAFYKRFWQRLLAGESIREEFVNKTRDGQLVTVESSASPVLDAQGRRIGFIAVQDDVTERKQAEKEMRKSEERFHRLFDSNTIGITVAELTGRILEANDAYLAMLGYTREELLSGVVRWDDRTPAEYREKDQIAVEQLRKTGIAQPYEKEMLRKDGTRVPLLIGIATLEASEGSIIAYSVDLSERQQAEEALRQSEERFHRSFSSSPVAMTLSEAKTGLMIDVNERLAGMLGYAREELIGHTSLEMGLWVDPAERARVVADVEASIPIREREVRLRTKAGKTRFVLDSIELLQFGKERVLLSAFQDVTERKMLEEQLRQAQKMEAVGQLAGGVAHDFNNLLTVILGNADLLASKLSSDSRLSEEIGEIRGAGQRAAALTQQLLAFSRKQVLEPVVLRLNDLVGNLEKMLRRVIGEDQNLVTRLAPSTSHVRADPGQLEQVIMNLAVNARDAMPRGGRLTIETADVELDDAYAERHTMVPPGRYTMLAVSDTGVGMDVETQARIFEPFFTTKEKGKGTGLGLSTVYGIVKQSEGYIWVYSEPGKGTTFKVYLPRVEEAGPRVPTRSSESLPATGTETVLIAEDEQAIRALTRRVLEERGYRVLEAGSGKDALERVRTEEGSIHLLLTDLVMPDMGGTELASRLQELHPDMRVLFMSGYTDEGVVRNGLLGSGRAFLQKPFTPQTLARKVREVLS